jgi:hypothetical protein
LDCSICNGSGYEHAIGTWLPHQNFGDPDCPGFLLGVLDGEQGYIGCNDCYAVIQTVPAAYLLTVLKQMELNLDSSVERCPHCGKANRLEGLSQVFIYICRECGKVVKLGR